LTAVVHVYVGLVQEGQIEAPEDYLESHPPVEAQNLRGAGIYEAAGAPFGGHRGCFRCSWGLPD
jgi:hypothetical protein